MKSIRFISLFLLFTLLAFKLSSLPFVIHNASHHDCEDSHAAEECSVCDYIFTLNNQSFTDENLSFEILDNFYFNFETSKVKYVFFVKKDETLNQLFSRPPPVN